MQSGSCLSEHQVRDRDDGATLARAFSAAIGCEGVGDVAGCLRGASVLDVLRAEEGSLINFDQRGRPGPVVDGVLLPTTPRAAVAAGTMPDVPFLFGTNADEGSILVQGANVDTAEEYDRTLTQLGGGPARLAELSALYPPSDYGGDRTAAATRAVTDILFSCPSRRTARDWVGAGGRAWVYQFTHHTLLGEAGLGAFHGSELFVLFRDGMLRPEDDALSQRMLGYWTQHAVAGSPGSVEGVDWPAFEATTEPFLELGTPVAVRAGWPGAARCDALDTIFGTGL